MGSLMSSSMKAAIRLGQNYNENLEVHKYTNFEEIQNLFGINKKFFCVVLMKFWTWNQLKVQLHHGLDLHCLMIKWSSGQKQKYVFTQTPFCAWGSCQTIQKQIEDGKAKWQTFDRPLLTDNYWESMENQSSSSGILSQDLRHCRFCRKSRMICKNEALNPENLKIELFSCQCSMTSIGHEKERRKLCFECRKSQDVREEILAWTLDVHWGPGNEKKRMQLQTCGKMEFCCFPNGAAIQGNRSPNIHGVPVPWVVESWEG